MSSSSSRKHPAPRTVSGLQEAKAEVRAAGPFVAPRASRPPEPESGSIEAQRREVEILRRVLEEFENGSEEELSDDEMDERVRARQRENEAAGRPRGGGLQHRQAILAEIERERRD